MVKKMYSTKLRRIIIIMIALISMIGLFNESHAEPTGNTVIINLGAGANQKIDKLVYTYRKNGVYDYNLYCAQKGESIRSSKQYTFKEYVWKYDSGIFKSEEDFKKINWIKDNIWYLYDAPDSSKYSYDEITNILHKVNGQITKEQVQSVFGDKKRLFKTYQYVAWNYTKNKQSINEESLKNNDSTAYTIYRAIINLADKYYQTSGTLTATADTKVSYENGKFVWKNVSISNGCILDYTSKVYVDGKEYDKSKYTIDENAKTITFTGLSNEENHTFSFDASVPKVYCAASVWINDYAQNMLEITQSYREMRSVSKNAVYTITEKTEYKEGTFNLILNKVDENSNPVNDVEFKLKAENNGQEETLSTGENSNSVSKNGIVINQEESIKYYITEIKVGNGEYVKIVGNIGLIIDTGLVYEKTEVVDGVKTTYFRYYVKNARFSNGSNKETVFTKNGDAVEVSLEMTGEQSAPNISVTIPNKRKEFDLALTKTIVTKKDIKLTSILDFDNNNTLDEIDAKAISYIDAKYSVSGEFTTETLKEAIEYIFKEQGKSESEAKNKANEIYNSKYKEYESNQQELFEMIDLDHNNIINEDDAYILVTSKDIKDYIATTGRINGIDLTKLRENQDTTATYNMKKDTVSVKKGDIVIYEIKVYNEGDYDSNNIQIYDYIPEGLTICDEDGNTATDGTVTFNYNGKQYVWELEENGKVAKTTITDTIASFQKNHLSNSSVFIACKVDSNVTNGKVLYNVAAIRGAEALDESGNKVAVQDENGFIDRDSDTKAPVESTGTQNLIDKYSSEFETKSIDEDVKNINKDIYDFQDDDDFDRVVVQNDSVFDLALRKSISKVGTSESTMKDLENSRLPVITEDSVNECTVSGTGEYYHPKESVKVNVGDYVEYTIRVYNEGKDNDYSGYAKQITDYLPSGVEFYGVVNSDGKWITEASNGKYVTDGNDYGKYELTYNKENNSVVIDYTKSKAVLKPTNNLLNVYSLYADKENSDIKGYYTATEYNNEEDSGSYVYQEIKIICKVTDSTTKNKRLTNLAEITNSTVAEIQEDGTIKEDTTIKDKDSTAGNISVTTGKSDLDNNKVNLDTYYEDRTVNDAYNDYYPGLEDDDDFETIIVGKDEKDTPKDSEYSISLIKINADTQEPIKDIDFKVSKNETEFDVTTGENGIVNITDPAKTSTSEKITEAGTDIYVIKEIDTDQNIIKLKEPITIKVEKSYNEAEKIFIVKSVSIEGGNQNKKEVELENGEKVTVEVNLKQASSTDESGRITRTATIEVIIPNKTTITPPPSTPDEPEIHKGVKTVENQDSGYDGEQKHDWVIQVNMPQEINQYTKLLVTDKIDERLVFSGLDSVKVSVLNEKELVKDTDYKLDYNEETRTLQITFIDEDFTAGKNLAGNSIIEIRFNTTFARDENGNIIPLNEEVPNQADLVYDFGEGDKHKKSETPEVHTGAVAVYKYNSKTNVALEGAKFKIATSEENAKAGEFVKDSSGNDLEAISNSKGIATFTGLEFGGDASSNEENKTVDETTGATVYKYNFDEAKATYYIVETEAPIGFNKCEDIIAVEVSKNTTLTEIKDMKSIANTPVIFDLALRKWVTEAIVTENGKTQVTKTGHKAEDNPEAIVKVDLKKSKLNNVVVKFRYSIRVTNQGEIAGEAQEISDYIPNGLKFDPADNPEWTEVDGKVTTDALKGTVLQPGESAEVEILLTWINGEKNMGVMTNTAEISKDHNDYGVPDIDSTPNNQVPGEDDIDDAPVMLTIKTGSEIIMYVTIGLGFLAIIVAGAIIIKKKVL